MRLSWDKYFLNLAHQASSMSTCPRLSAGAVVVKDKRVVSTGYNGAPSGLPHCIDVGCLMVNDHCIRTVHAEANALLWAGVRNTTGATLYVTHASCRYCILLIINARISRVVYADDYGVSNVELLKDAGITVEKYAQSL